MGLFSKLFKNKFENMSEKELETQYMLATSNEDIATFCKLIKTYLRRQPNYNYIKRLEASYVLEIMDSIWNKGYGLDNDFLNFITKIKFDKFIPLMLIRELMEKGLLDSKAEFLYNESLYNENESAVDTSFRVRALTYANNPKLQKNASKQINVLYLTNDDGTIKSAEEIRNILDEIEIENSEEIRNIFAELEKEI